MNRAAAIAPHRALACAAILAAALVTGSCLAPIHWERTVAPAGAGVTP